jgi:hypothetical protein
MPNLNSLIPPHYRLAAIIAVVALLCAAAFAGGWQVATWRADAGHAVEMADLNKQIADMQLAIADQNGKTDVLKAKTEAADAARAAAQRNLAEAIKIAQARAAGITGIDAKDCEGVMLEYWRMRQ